jgi:hypothetical protein
VHAILIAVHAACGGTGLLLAVPVLLSPKRRGRHTRLGRAYAVAAVGLSLSAFGLFAYRPAELFGLAILGTLTLGWLIGGLWFARRRPRAFGPRGWRIWHLNLMGSTVISFVTGFAVQMTHGNLVAWLAPTVIGSLLIARRTVREVAAARPRTADHPRPGRQGRPVPLG